ncbi:PP2C family protein-serine/threonine phosphatase [Streptomyces sp. NPDC101181]|uniref:PP2C family protein-serine/threonine phosphatase n=1 Tax=Streptomyces sp. NPDC101181 TaxID=3366125 RepID=UPI003802971C
MPHPVLLVDRAGTVLHVNARASAILPEAAPGVLLQKCVPGWLHDAHFLFASEGVPQGGTSVAGTVDEQSYKAYLTRQPDGSTVWWLVDDTDHRRAVDALTLERKRTALLAKASSALLSSLEPELCMRVTAQLAAEHFADAAVVIAPSSGPRLPAVSCLRGEVPRREEWNADPREMPGLAEALKGFAPVPSRWIDPRSTPSWLIPDDFGEVGSIVVTPLPGYGASAGALILLRSLEAPAFSDDEEVFARLFAARSGAAVSAARLYTEQASVSQMLTRELLPPVLHRIAGVEFAGGYRPSQPVARIGGDFYDVHPASTVGEPTFAVLGDVCGKGLEAAALTGRIRNILHALLPMAENHQRVIGLLNSALLNSHHSRFATLVMASAVREASSVKLRITSAGHPPALIVRAGGSVEEGTSRGTLLGVMPDATATTVDETLAPKDFCVLFTDGFTEAKGGPLGNELFGEERLRRALSQCAGMPAEAVVEHVQMLASEWVGAASHDDMAIMVIAAPALPVD